MSKYHINPTTGEPGECSAQAGNCPFGEATDHYDSPQTARATYETSQESKSSTFQKLGGPARPKLVAQSGDQKTYRQSCSPLAREIRENVNSSFRMLIAVDNNYSSYRPAIAGDFERWIHAKAEAVRIAKEFLARGKAYSALSDNEMRAMEREIYERSINISRNRFQHHRKHVSRGVLPESRRRYQRTLEELNWNSRNPSSRGNVRAG